MCTHKTITIASAFAVMVLVIQMSRITLGDYVRCRRPSNCTMRIGANDEWWPMNISSGPMKRRSKSNHIESNDSRGKFIRRSEYKRLPNHYSNLPAAGRRRAQEKPAEKYNMVKTYTESESGGAAHRWNRVDRLFNEPIPGEMLFPPKVVLFRAQPLQRFYATRSTQQLPMLYPTTYSPRPTSPMFKTPKMYPFYEHEAITDRSLTNIQQRGEYRLTTSRYDENDDWKPVVYLPKSPKHNEHSSTKQYFPPIVYASPVKLNQHDNQIDKPDIAYEYFNEQNKTQRPHQFPQSNKIAYADLDIPKNYGANDVYDSHIDTHESTQSTIDALTSSPVTRTTIQDLLDELMLTIPKKVDYHNPSSDHRTEPTYRHHKGLMNGISDILVSATTKPFVDSPIFIAASASTISSIPPNHRTHDTETATPRTVKTSIFATVGGFIAGDMKPRRQPKTNTFPNTSGNQLHRRTKAQFDRSTQHDQVALHQLTIGPPQSTANVVPDSGADHQGVPSSRPVMVRRKIRRKRIQRHPNVANASLPMSSLTIGDRARDVQN